MKSTDVLIKWTGSKRLQAEKIIRYFPENIDTYYEPFLGGGSILFYVFDMKIKKFVCSDINEPLIDIWNLVKNNPNEIVSSYRTFWHKLKQGGKPFYYKIREEFNKDQNPCKFLFLLRTCRNGLVRYNKNGEFNSAFHFGRNGINPDKFANTIMNWHQKVEKRDVQFIVKDYRDISSEKGDFIYLDPPYLSTTQVYYGNIDFGLFWTWLRKQKGSYNLSLNGFKNNVDLTLDVPKDLYDEHHFIDNGLNTFNQLCKNVRVESKDSLYVKFLHANNR